MANARRFFGTLILASTLLQRVSAQTPGGPLLSDGFESGSLGPWTLVEDPPGQVSITERAAACGRYGLEIALGKNCQTACVKDTSPEREASYAARWRFDLGTVELPLGVSTSIFVARDDVQNRAVLRVRLKKVAEGDYRILGEVAQDGQQGVVQMPWTAVPMKPGIPYAFSLQWTAASSATAADGTLSLSIGDTTLGTLTSLLNGSQRVDSVSLGAVGAFGSASGEMYIDGFASETSAPSLGYADCSPPYVEPLASSWERYWGVPFRSGQSHLRLLETGGGAWAVQAMEGETWMAEGHLSADTTTWVAGGLAERSMVVMGVLVGATGESSLVTCVASPRASELERVQELHDVTQHMALDDANATLGHRVSHGGFARQEAVCPGSFTGPVSSAACSAWFSECVDDVIDRAIGNHPFLCGDLEAGALAGCLISRNIPACLILPAAYLICMAAISDEVQPEITSCGLCFSTCMCSVYPSLCATGRLPVRVEVRRSSWVSCFNNRPVRIAWRFEPPQQPVSIAPWGAVIEGNMFVDGERETFRLPDECPPFWNAHISAGLTNDSYPVVDGSWDFEYSFDELVTEPVAVINVDEVYPGPESCNTYKVIVRIEPDPPSIPGADIMLQINDPVYSTMRLHKAFVPAFTDFAFPMRVPRGWIWSLDGRSVQQETLRIDCGMRGGTDIQRDQLVVLSCLATPTGGPFDCPECEDCPDCDPSCVTPDCFDPCPGAFSCEDCFYLPDAGAPPPSPNPNYILCAIWGICCNGCFYWDFVDVDCELVCVPCSGGGGRSDEGPETYLPGARVRMRSSLVGHDSYDVQSRRVQASAAFYVHARALCVMGMERVEYYVDDVLIETRLASAEQDFESAARVDVPSLAPGEHTLHIVGYGADGGRSSTRLWVDVDSAAPSRCGTDSVGPQVAMTTPANGAVVQPGTIALGASAEDPSAVSMVAFYAGDVLVGSDTTAPYSVAWQATPGDWEIGARATDACGNTAWAAVRWVHVVGPCDGDASVEAVALSSPANGSTIDAGCPVRVAAAATDASGISRVEFRVNGTLLATDTAAPYEMQYWTSSGGTLTFEARAVDGCGRSRLSAPVTITVDGSGAPCDCDEELPTAAITAPADGLVVPRAGVDLVVSAGDNLGVDLVYFEITGQSPNPVLLSGPPWTYRFVPNANANGSYSVRARAVDFCGQLGPWSSSVALTAANQPPTPVNDSGSTRRNTAITLNVTANDADPNGDTVALGAGGAGGVAQPPLHGSVTRLDANRFLYTPHPDYVGPDSFVYRVYDGFGGAGTARVDLTIAP